MKAKIFVRGITDKRAAIRNQLKNEYSRFYGKPCGERRIFTAAGILRCGFAETEEGFRWLRSSGTYIEFLDTGDIFVSGTRHSVDEFLGQFFDREELLAAEVKSIESREPSRPIGDTL